MLAKYSFFKGTKHVFFISENDYSLVTVLWPNQLPSFNAAPHAGLIVDVLGDHVVASASAAWVQLHKAAILNALQAATGVSEITWRADAGMMKLEGIVDAVVGSDSASDAVESAVEVPLPVEPVVVLEEGVKYLADPTGQKTGFYADQRDSRKFLRACVQGKRVLDLCCYSGGFAINSALYGAESVVGVDSSAPAIQLARSNAELNNVSDRYALLGQFVSF